MLTHVCVRHQIWASPRTRLDHAGVTQLQSAALFFIPVRCLIQPSPQVRVTPAHYTLLHASGDVVQSEGSVVGARQHQLHQDSSLLWVQFAWPSLGGPHAANVKITHLSFCENPAENCHLGMHYEASAINNWWEERSTRGSMLTPALTLWSFQKWTNATGFVLLLRLYGGRIKE